MTGRKWPLALAGVAMVVGLFVWNFTVPQPHVPLLDANRNRLAETYEEGYCSGIAFWRTRGQGNAQQAADCREANSMTEKIDYEVVQLAFCSAVTEEGYQGGTENCITILQTEQLWPTYDGALTASWNDKFPYPGDTFTSTPAGDGVDDGRTGDRDGNQR